MVVVADRIPVIFLTAKNALCHFLGCLVLGFGAGGTAGATTNIGGSGIGVASFQVCNEDFLHPSARWGGLGHKRFCFLSSSQRRARASAGVSAV